ncbi:MAG: hypothetical protein LR015_01280 [Verrucomicrobia bacterium]|nr:hypothetical protein [Verrucomicrobiota bacterium]
MTLWHKDLAQQHFAGADIPEPALHALYSLLMEHPRITDLFQGGGDLVAKFIQPLTPTGIVYKQPYFGMTTVQEQAYCEWYCSQIFSGTGAVVELGSFLGSLTKSMVDGLRANPTLATRRSKVLVHDLFWWDFVMEACVQGTPYQGCCKEGDWFC